MKYKEYIKLTLCNNRANKLLKLYSNYLVSIWKKLFIKHQEEQLGDKIKLVIWHKMT